MNGRAPGAAPTTDAKSQSAPQKQDATSERRRHTASAPGKVMLIGEYAVLDGAPALVAAVNRRATVSVEPATTGGWELTAQELGIRALLLCPDGSLPDTLQDSTRQRLAVFDAVRRAVVDAYGAATIPLSVTIDSSRFLAGGNKLGVGSSAAVAVALGAALAASVGGPHAGTASDRDALFRLAADAHRAAQGGAGSGADVAASVYGGLISYTQGTTPTPLTWPRGLAVMAVSTGTGSRTPDLVARVADFARRDPQRFRADSDRLAALARQAEPALRDPDAFIALASEYFDALSVLDSHAEAGIVTDRHRELATLAKKAGAVFKTSGAGGGDLGLMLSRGEEQAERLSAELHAAGASVVPLRFGEPGVSA